MARKRTPQKNEVAELLEAVKALRAEVAEIRGQLDMQRAIDAAIAAAAARENARKKAMERWYPPATPYPTVTWESPAWWLNPVICSTGAGTGLVSGGGKE